jgi:hypothetical protein
MERDRNKTEMRPRLRHRQKQRQRQKQRLRHKQTQTKEKKLETMIETGTEIVSNLFCFWSSTFLAGLGPSKQDEN